jgi:hypothetical protein
MPMGHTMLQHQDIYIYVNISAYRLHIEARSTAKGAEIEGMCASSSSAFRRIMGHSAVFVQHRNMQHLHGVKEEMP